MSTPLKISIQNGGKTATTNGELDLRKQEGVIAVLFKNRGTSNVQISFGGLNGLIPPGGTAPFQWDYPYVDKTLYTYTFLPLGAAPINLMDITITKRMD